jgi:hypothetical protein
MSISRCLHGWEEVQVPFGLQRAELRFVQWMPTCRPRVPRAETSAMTLWYLAPAHTDVSPAVASDL